MTQHSAAYWADVVAELANRRMAVWSKRLHRPVQLDATALSSIVRRAHIAGALGESASMNVVERGILDMEAPLRTELAQRFPSMSAEGRA